MVTGAATLHASQGFHQSPATDHQSPICLISTWSCERIDEAAAARRVIPHLEAGVKIEDERCGNASAGSIDREHGLSADLEIINVLHHGASPVREIEKIHARLIGVHRGL